MTDYLLIRLYGALASWGEIAVGELRHSAVQPSRSALLGLLGAALGIERRDDATQTALAQGYRFGIQLLASGSPLRDYHTIQMGEPRRKERFRSRRQSLAADKVGTLLSQREYRCDSIATIAIEALPQAPHSLAELAQALRQPRFVLYLGRKSCPLALPMLPQLVQAEHLHAAFAAAQFPSPMALLDYKTPRQDWPTARDRHAFGLGQLRYYWEEGMSPGMPADFDHLRQDQPLSRSRWQFAPRREWVALAEGGAAA
ncbi:type I-E CRISPR-associated protein Cas5/CasD [Allofranklinella schreckenbergeri]|uniref:Type I-E CRISPR-associated protein Cas5/CasD n=1 Tax=Allofranklinella schreckenbergeri TaxID=1076744 RepID=A0A3M6Q8T4_9BURK|nr:type I-E CRISPR-associated protein Cas5/CasD [Allofranklinella schreckenbergeri]RMW99549.1 type I-E CRISPR-associated protein Cas5/CasD [Allofranklinella schreckenbergeri]